MGTREALRIIATLVGGGFLVYAAVSVLKGSLYDVDDGHVDRTSRPVTFWLLVFGMTTLGLTILGVGWDWSIAGIARRVLGQ